MLHVEQPNPHRRGDHQHRHLNEQIGFEADGETRGGSDPEECRVRPVHARPLALPAAGPREPMVDEEQAERCQEEENDGIARETVAEAFPAGRLEVLLHGERPDVSFAAPIQFARARVMECVLVAPVSMHQ